MIRLARRTRGPSLRRLYAELNVRFWKGSLPPSLKSELALYGGDPQTRGVQVRRVPAALIEGEVRGLAPRVFGEDVDCHGWFRPPGRFTPARIRILSPLSEEYERKVLLHEMIHYAVWLEAPADPPHGFRFVAELERLALLGERWALDQAVYYSIQQLEQDEED